MMEILLLVACPLLVIWLCLKDRHFRIAVGIFVGIIIGVPVALWGFFHWQQFGDDWYVFAATVTVFIIVEAIWHMIKGTQQEKQQ
jgi:hypothetical protein